MPDDHRDVSHLWDMREGAKAIVNFTRSRTPQDYRSDLLLRSAVERQIEIIGEAANRVGAAFRAARPQIPWRRIIAQRNVLIHEYGEIDHDAQEDNTRASHR